MDTQFDLPPILLVEDNSELRRSLEWLLTGEGYAVVTAIHGADALGKLQAGLRPCLIILNLEMPEMNGFEFRKAQLQDAQLASIPLVIYSALSDPHMFAAQLKAAAYFQKPLDVEALLRVVEAHCRPPFKASANNPRRAESTRRKPRSCKTRNAEMCTPVRVSVARPSAAQHDDESVPVRLVSRTQRKPAKAIGKGGRR